MISGATPAGLEEGQRDHRDLPRLVTPRVSTDQVVRSPCPYGDLKFQMLLVSRLPSVPYPYGDLSQPGTRTLAHLPATESVVSQDKAEIPAQKCCENSYTACRRT